MPNTQALVWHWHTRLESTLTENDLKCDARFSSLMLADVRIDNGGYHVQKVLDALDDLSQRVPMGPMLFYSYNSGLADAEGRPNGVVDAKGRFVPAAGVLSARAARK